MTSKPQRATIRKQQLADTMNPVLAAMNDEMGQRSAKLLQRFWALYVHPLEHRVKWLEQPWYKRVGRKMPPLPDIIEGEASE